MSFIMSYVLFLDSHGIDADFENKKRIYDVCTRNTWLVAPETTVSHTSLYCQTTDTRLVHHTLQGVYNSWKSWRSPGFLVMLLENLIVS